MTRKLEPNTKELQAVCSQLVDLITPNEHEVLAMSEALSSNDVWSTYLNSLCQTDLESLLVPFLNDIELANSFSIAKASLKLLSRTPCVLTKLGSKGVLHTELLSTDDTRLRDRETQGHILACSSIIAPSLGIAPSRVIPLASSQDPLQSIGAIYMRHFPAMSLQNGTEVRSVNGVGDTFLGVLIATLVSDDAVRMEGAIARAQKGALLTLQSREAVSPELLTLPLQ